MNNKQVPPEATLHPFPSQTESVVQAPQEIPDIPEGKVELVRTYLEMHAPPAPWRSGSRNEASAILRAQHCTASFYRYLYNSVGEPWLWYDRLELAEDELCGIIQDDQVEIYVLYVAGTPAGFGELDRRQEGEIELAYFGLMPEFIGRGLGPYFLHHLLDTAWSYEPRRLWVHTCTFDHPGAMAVYQRAGFTPYRQQRLIIDTPEKPL